MIYLKKDLDEESEYIIDFLSVLLSEKIDYDRKTHILEKDLGLTMTEEMKEEVNTMCNLSEHVYESGVQNGIEKGIKTGIKTAIKRMLTKLSVDEIVELGYEKQLVMSIAEDRN